MPFTSHISDVLLANYFRLLLRSWFHATNASPTSLILPSFLGPPLVFASSVQSGFLPPKRATADRNRSRTDPDIEGTEPNHLGPVYFGLWSRFRPIQTGFFAYNLLYQYKPFVS
ncbi:uncharacterized protein LACBIDRAFT_317458 [Laccaria bicolor S238N-H82]|uniref:Predicted protein n=1 Tax=Laccaria bicolor (strain S238N-H82 / ATCC MYA-4686) TaxID=486041 RepID=B0E1T6_LACBS|nr:uncharacterized protein LACBIDRAFT_317458 [Laccaria bicolor S238N-H82]EDQ99196.1 predicted protein [Laccaria bicolor S238N-H82]|eukprot:XP_001890163.1 predicted protein [Laccaria bicolor S238N-H82]